MSAKITLRGWREEEYAEAEVTMEGIDYPRQVTALAGLLAASLGIEVREGDSPGPPDPFDTLAWVEPLVEELREMAQHPAIEVAGQREHGQPPLLVSRIMKGKDELADLLLRHFPGEWPPGKTSLECVEALLVELKTTRQAQQDLRMTVRSVANNIRPITRRDSPVYLSLDDQPVKDALERLRDQSQEMIRDAADRRILPEAPPETS